MITDLVAAMFMVAPAGTSGVSSHITQVFTGLAALVGAYSAYRLTKNGSDADDLKESLRKLEAAERARDDMQADVLTLRGYIFTLRQITAGAGLTTPDPPTLRVG